MDFDFETESLGQDKDGNDVFMRDIWPSQQEISDTIASAINQQMFIRNYADGFKGDERWQNLPTPKGKTFDWDPKSTYVRKPPYFNGMPAEPEPVSDITGARVLALLGDSVTTDHISPAGNIKPGTPAAQYLDDHGVERKDYNSYGSRRGNHEVMIAAPSPISGLNTSCLTMCRAATPATSPRKAGRRPSSTTRRKTMPHRTFRWSCWAARSTAPDRRGTGPPRARRCWACVR